MRTFLVLAAIGTALAVYGSLVPLNFRPLAWSTAVDQFRHLPYFSLGVRHRADWVANLLLFVPLGFTWLGALLVDRRDGPRTTLAAVAVVLGCSGLSLAIEFAQLWFPPRTTSQNDIVAEVIGAAVGVVVWLLAGQSLTDWVREFAACDDRRRQLGWLLEAYVLGLALFSVLPLDVTLNRTELVRKYRVGRLVLVPLSDLGPDADSALRMAGLMALSVPVGIFAATWRRPAARPVRSWRGSLALAATLATSIELAQAVVYTRHCSTSDLLASLLGAVVGVAISRLWFAAVLASDASDWPRCMATRYWMLWLGIYSVLMTAASLAPWQFTREPARVGRRFLTLLAPPFAALYWGSEFAALTHVLKQLLAFLPVGALTVLALRSQSGASLASRHALAVAPLVAAVLALPMELLQALFPPNLPDCTDVLLAAAGGAVGQFLVLRLLAARRTTS